MSPCHFRPPKAVTSYSAHESAGFSHPEGGGFRRCLVADVGLDEARRRRSGARLSLPDWASDTQEAVYEMAQQQNKLRRLVASTAGWQAGVSLTSKLASGH